MGVYSSESTKGGKGVEEDLKFFVLRLIRILEAISGPPLRIRLLEKDHNFLGENPLMFTFPQSQTTVMKSQQDRIENNNALADDLKSQLSQAQDKLGALQGNCTRRSRPMKL